jgi:ATP-binding cassette subfamily B protein
LNRILREQLLGIRVIRAYHAEQYEQSRFAAANHALWQNNITAARIMALMFPMMMMVHVGLTLAIYWIGAYIIAAAGIPDRLRIFSDMVVFSNYAMQVITAFMLLNLVFILVPRAQVSIRRLLEVLMVKPGIVDGTAPVQEQSEHGTVEFSQVSFVYPGAAAPVLQDISFRVERGKTLAIIGATGSGKTSLVQLLNRTYDVSSGSVLVDGQNVRDYAQVDLHRRIGYVPQQAVLMTGTIAENIAYGDPGRPAPDRQAIEDAARIACCTEFIDKLPAGYDSPVAQGGINFSGGQRQRLSIARAIAWQPEIFIFDDSFSALDYATDRQIRQQLDEALSAAVKIIVAQRIGTIRQADEILVLDHGRIVGRGTHDALMHSCTVYQEIARSQLSEEELAYD